jgi:2-keto-4-pentenoate hydratase/2-oxohepta-3-ene-1,7-dioic acid hydratase in catechol pathway
LAFFCRLYRYLQYMIDRRSRAADMTQDVQGLLTFVDQGRPRAGVLIDGCVHALDDFGGPFSGATVMELLERDGAWPDELARAAAGRRPRSGRAVVDSELLAPLPSPGAIYCAGANYRDHLAEMLRRRGIDRVPERRTDDRPWHFVRPGRACAGAPKGRVSAPDGCRELDWEAELAVVIGRPARNVPPAEALSYVAGYMVANDLSARDLARRPDKEPGTPFHFDWLGHKVFEGSTPMGPWITPASDVDPQNLGIRLWVNDVLKQDSCTSQMIFSVAEQIAYLSRRVWLHPGDVVLTGTPAGVGAGRGEFLQPGDRIRVQIDGLGELETTIA